MQKVISATAVQYRGLPTGSCFSTRAMRAAALIDEFIADYAPSLGCGDEVRVRGRSNWTQLKNDPSVRCHVREIRSAKHDHLAVIWDEPGNAFVLTRNGQRLQLLESELKMHGLIQAR